MTRIRSKSPKVSSLDVESFKSRTVTKLTHAIRVRDTLLLVNKNKPNTVYVASYLNIGDFSYSSSGRQRWIGDFIEALGKIGAVDKSEVDEVLRSREEEMDAARREYNLNTIKELARDLGIKLTASQLKRAGKKRAKDHNEVGDLV